ncbi:hypothetical protein SSS_04012 [Sarcoptes scabiei]|nr:hypothetical protein SSS_04012 [Sarcoptes scabiei]
MMNMGGPRDENEVQSFLTELFLDRDIIEIPMQKYLGPFIAKRRSSKVAEKYKATGHLSSLHYWTEKQGEKMIEKLDQISPETGPHQFYLAFRYNRPSLGEAIEQIERTKAERVVAFSQYSQYCCNTSGSSINQIARYFLEKNIIKPEKYRLSFIERWPLHSGLIKAFVELISNEIKQLSNSSIENFDKDQMQRIKGSSDEDVLLLFTAHSIPLKTVNAGDTYTMEVSATVMAVMEQLQFRYPYRLIWQSKVGPLSWQAPATDDAIKGFIKKGHRKIILIPISFVNEHVETLHELDIEYCKELIEEMNLKEPIFIRRCPTPNDHHLFTNGLAEIVKNHLKSKIDISPQLLTQCPLCEKDVCRNSRRWLRNLKQAQQQ